MYKKLKIVGVRYLHSIMYINLLKHNFIWLFLLDFHLTVYRMLYFLFFRILTRK